MIRAATAADQSALVDLARATGLFEAEELGFFSGMMTECFNGEMPGHEWLVLCGEPLAEDGEPPAEDGEPSAEDSGIIGGAYFAPEMMADGVWNLWFIGVHPDQQGQGHGSTLLTAVEDAVHAQGARLLLVETSGTDDMELARQFYVKANYKQEACICDFYKAGDDKIVFRKAF